MVNGTVADAAFLHAADHLLKSVQILCRITVQLHIGDMAAVGESVVWSLQLDLIPGGDVVVNWDVEGVGIIFPISNAGDFSEFFSIHTDKPAG